MQVSAGPRERFFGEMNGLCPYSGVAIPHASGIEARDESRVDAHGLCERAWSPGLRETRCQSPVPTPGAFSCSDGKALSLSWPIFVDRFGLGKSHACKQEETCHRGRQWR